MHTHMRRSYRRSDGACQNLSSVREGFVAIEHEMVQKNVNGNTCLLQCKDIHRISDDDVIGIVTIWR